MSEKLKEIFIELQKDKKDTKKTTFVLLGISAVCLIVCIVGYIIRNQGMTVAGMVLFSLILAFTGFRSLIHATSSSGLKKSLKTLEATDALKYIDEILKKEYKSEGRICFSEHYLYVIGRGIFAFEDMLNVDRPKPNNEFYINTIDGKRHRVIMKVAVMKDFLERQNKITFDGDYKDIKEKVRIFKETGKK